MKKKILLFGATGMAGHIAYFYLKSTGKYEIKNVVFRNKLTEDSIIVDVANKNEVASLVKEIKPDIILNCIGVLIKGSSKRPDNAILINAYFPHLLKRLADEVGAKLIHISTDCVFSGEKGSYSENDFRDADDIYGRSKALGEIINDKDLTIRTSIIGPELKDEGEGLFHWFMKQTDCVKGYKTAIWGGVTTFELAKAIDFSIQNDLIGLIHLSNGIKINKYNLLLLIKNIWEMKIEIEPIETFSIDKSITKSKKTNYNVPTYEVMLKELKLWMEKYSNIYSKNYK